MKTLITAVEEWIDDRVWKASRVAEHEAQFDDNEQKLNVLHEQVTELKALLYLDSSKADAGESMHEGDQALEEFKNTIEDLESRFNDLESEVEDAQSAIEDIPDAYSIEVMIDDAVETKVMDAVMAELDSIDFKVTVER